MLGQVPEHVICSGNAAQPLRSNMAWRQTLLQRDREDNAAFKCSQAGHGWRRPALRRSGKSLFGLTEWQSTDLTSMYDDRATKGLCKSELMITVSEAIARARGAIFRIPIEPASEGHWWWGTGFFISAAGHALTAYHNLPATVKNSRGGHVQGVHADRTAILFDFIPICGDAERDIALLKLRDAQGGCSHLTIAALPNGLSDEDRVRFWAGRAIVVCGFPIKDQGQEEDAIAGHISLESPLSVIDEKEENRVVAQVERLKIVTERRAHLPGISGGPVTDLGCGLVVAVEGAFDWDRNLVLASEILGSLPTWPDEVRLAAETLENTPAALRDRTNRLLAVVRRPWDPERTPPGALLRADCAAAVPFHGRDDECADLEAWCGSQSRVGIRLYSAAGGMGKTRLVMELCDRVKSRGWRTGFLLEEAAHASPDLWSALIRQAAPLLLVVDYAESRAAELVSLLRAVGETTSGVVRIILLARAAGDWWEALKREGHGVGDILLGPATRWHELRPLAMDRPQRLASYRIAAKAFAEALGKPVPSAEPDDLDAPHFERVLLLHMSAMAAIDGVAVKGDQGLLNYVLHRERRFWSKQLRTTELPLRFEDAVAQAMAVVTLGGGAYDAKHARMILREIPLLNDQSEIVCRTIATLLHEAYPGVKFIEPILPDLLGEHLVQVELGKDERLLDLVLGPPMQGNEQLSS